ncbi:MAG: sodium:proline symporter, partial [Fidelibacterota bacterium]
PPFSQFPYTLYLIVPWSTVVWLLVTLSTPPADENTLVSFYKRIHPGGPLWKPISAKLPEVESDSGYPLLFLDWVAGCVLVFSALFGTGKIILGDTGIGLAFLLLALGAAGVITRNMSRMGWEKVTR